MQQNTQDRPDAALDVAGSMVSAFPTPIVNYVWQDVASLNAELGETILAAASKHPGVVSSNIGGWQSPPDFFNWEVESVRQLRTRLQRFLVELTQLVLRPIPQNRKAHFDLRGWANLLRPGNYHGVHSHPGAFWSGTYFVSGNEEVAGHPLSGKLELLDPRAGASSADARDTTLYGRYLLNPVAGQMIIHPGWLQHYVHPYFGQAPRLSIAFDVGFELRE